MLDGGVLELSGAPSAWPDAGHESFDPQIAGVLGFSESWRVGSGASRRRMRLKTLVPTEIGPTLIPIVFPEDLGFTLEAVLDTPAPFLDYDGTPALRSEEATRLEPCADQRPLAQRYLRQERASAHGDVAIDSSFYWPPFPTGAVAGYTAPLDRWVETTIAGVATRPVALQGYFSQTYRPEHHNFTESFIFDPHLEEDVDATTLAEWDARGIEALVQPAGSDNPQLRALTTDGRLVDLAVLLE